MQKSYNFSSIKYSELEEIVDIRLGSDEAHDYKFDEWFQFEYDLSDFEQEFIAKLVKKHKRRLNFYQEETLKVKFIGAILNQVDFLTENYADWYDASLSGIVNGVELKGYPDFMVATGIREPKKPYFFIQEFKSSKPDKDPEIQLLAELLVSIEKNKSKIMRGAYIIGQIWKFVVLEKIGENAFEYFVSDAFDSLKTHDLELIYKNLQTIKSKYT